MDLLIQQFLSFDWWLPGTIAAERLLFLLYSLSVAYLLFFALAAMVRKGTKYPCAKRRYRYVVIFTADESDTSIADSVASFLEQDFPKNNYDVIVALTDRLEADVRQRLSQMSVTIIEETSPMPTKISLVQTTMATLAKNDYDVVVLMDADNVTEPTFLEQVNNAYYCGGMVIQTHRVAKNLDTNIAILDAVSEEINNSIFRRGHVNVGLSSALIGSGMVFNFEWFRTNIPNAKDIGNHLETMLLEQRMFVEYLEDVRVYSHRATGTADFSSKRRTWLSDRFYNLRMAIYRMPSALFSGNYDYCDKLFQWMMPSRMILLGTLVIITVLVTYVAWEYSIKWWILLLLMVAAFGVAIPDHLVDARLVKSLKSLPLIIMLTVVNQFRPKIKRDKI